MTLCSGIYPARSNGESALRKSLFDILETTGFQQVNADGLVTITIEREIIPLLIMEIPEEGEDSCDASIQAELSMKRTWLSNMRRNMREKTCCPTFLLTCNGPWIGVLGGIFTDRFIVQCLTDVLWATHSSTYDDKQIVRFAQLFRVLSQSLDELRAYYEQHADSVPYFESGQPHPRCFPYPTSYVDTLGHEHTFSYDTPLESDPTCVAFEATSESGKKLVVKFVDRYGKDAHEHMAQLGLAPVLHHCAPLYPGDTSSCEQSTEGMYLGPLRMVVMDFVKGTTAAAVDRKDWPSDFAAQARAILQRLHEGGYVFGDFRPPNVMICDGKVQLIDFDWAGRKGSVFYPLDLSSAIEWPGAALELIEPGHDIVMWEKSF
ncbi:hypothetical protein BOTBODRAFT_52492 [Botryobasidium botryosum FD-172 SS1]|uniref:Protein kinase domain-containing protein n=1 Tax=Botryobasidium botryosum (strain FD-172 SS1) TaxID=930990 RepID=A0A067MUW3_BOTB1|nr:hypothetical protein BOTBODRAFT_52492 [Botryobasidium botryosum FD-172 SS1]